MMLQLKGLEAEIMLEQQERGANSINLVKSNKWALNRLLQVLIR